MVLTPRQREVYEYIRRFSDVHGFAPTIAEIRAHLGLSSPATVHQSSAVSRSSTLANSTRAASPPDRVRWAGFFVASLPPTRRS